jgi:hypothetical protein
MNTCPGCQVALPERHLDPPHRFNASGECWQAFCDLTCYTIAKQDPAFIHQYAVDAYGAQHGGGSTRPITVVFALIGLCLALEKGYTGKEVQEAHMRIARVYRVWPRLTPPERPAELTVVDVLREETDERKDAMIREWSASVWQSWEDQHPWIRDTTDNLLYGSREGAVRKS